MCICVRERERESESLTLCVCVCVRERERESESLTLCVGGFFLEDTDIVFGLCLIHTKVCVIYILLSGCTILLINPGTTVIVLVLIGHTRR